MVRNYKRKSNRQQWGKNQMVEAVNAILKGELSMKKSANKYGVPKSTLKRYYEKARTNGLDPKDFKLGSYRTIFTEEQENKLKQCIKDTNLSLFEMTPIELRRMAFQYAELNGISHNFNRKTQLAGYDWYRNFMKRNQIQEKNEIDPPGSYGLNSTYSVEKFFDLLTDVQQFYKFPPNRIYNVHDKGVISIPNLTSKMFSTTDKTLSTIDFITVITCCNATGNFIPPLMVFPASQDDPDFEKGCPLGTKIVCHPSGSIQYNIFFPTWFNHFVNHAQPSSADPVLLLLDGQGSYVKNIEFIEKAKECNIHIISIPVNLSDKLYPLEVDFMIKLKKYYCEEQSKWNDEHKGQIIDLKNVGQIFNSAYAKATVPDNIINGFKECGIYPLNRYVLADDDKAPVVTPLIIEMSDNISHSMDNDSEDGSSGTQIKNSGISIKGPGDINNSLSNTEDLNFLFDNLTEDQEESCEKSSTDTVKEDEPFETIYQEDKFEFCD